MKAICLRFLNARWDTVQNQRYQLKNEKLELSFTLLKLDTVTQSHNIDLEPLGLCNSEPLKQ